MKEPILEADCPACNTPVKFYAEQIGDILPCVKCGKDVELIDNGKHAGGYWLPVFFGINALGSFAPAPIGPICQLLLPVWVIIGGIYFLRRYFKSHRS